MARKRPRRRWGLVLAAIVAVLLMAAPIVYLMVQWSLKPAQPRAEIPELAIASTPLMLVSTTIMTQCDRMVGMVLGYSNGAMEQVVSSNFEVVVKAMPEVNNVPRNHRYHMSLPPPAAGCQIPGSV